MSEHSFIGGTEEEHSPGIPQENSKMTNYKNPAEDDKSPDKSLVSS
jgi:hypothetical protein